MKKKNSKPVLSLSTALFKGSFVHNPVLTQIIGICPIVGAATTAANGLSLAVGVVAVLVLTEAVTSLLLKKVPRWLRMAAYTLLSLSVVLTCDRFIFSLTPDGGAGLGIYFYLLCVNALAVIRCEKFACKTTVLNAVTDGVAAGIGYGAVALIVGAVRELITYGTLFSAADAVPRFPQGALPFAALVIAGFLAAGHKWLLIKFYPDEIRDTFSMNAVYEKPVKKDPGLFADKRKPKVLRDYDEKIRPRHSAEEKEKGGEAK
ncbi:MAG: hypothetical protein IJO73_07140 [Clostridia bacterium]|nr:hypothetical protein [Clostridia bacterium]